MVSYGERLRNAREEKGLDLNKISREISIDKRYLEGLENEDSTVFPGEAYFIGFLKNYANYLELDSEYLLKLYHNQKIQETPPPKELYTTKYPTSFIILMSAIGAVVLALIITFICVFVHLHKKSVANNVVVAAGQVAQQYELTDRKFKKRVYKGDQLLIPTENEGQIILTVRETLSSFGLDTPAGNIYVDLADEAKIDINGDGISDMIVYVSDISSTDESRGAEVDILLHQGSETSNAVVFEEDIASADELKGKHNYKVIHEDNRAYPFTINASFRGPCIFRDKVDFKDSVETYYTRGETFTATPMNGIRLWISNSNTVKISIVADSKTFDLEIGAPGEIVAEDIKWIKDSDGRYRLVVIQLD